MTTDGHAAASVAAYERLRALADVCRMFRPAQAVGVWFVLAMLSVSTAAIQGVALRDGHTASLVAVPDTSVVTGFGSNPEGGGYHGCRFSPDGRRIAYIRRRADQAINEIIIMHNDGTHRERICDLYNLTLNNTTFLSWAEDGHIYWSEWGSTIYRVNLVTRQREAVMVCPIPPIRMATVSRDGARAAAQGKPEGKSDPNIIYTFDLHALTQQLLLPDTVSTQ